MQRQDVQILYKDKDEILNFLYISLDGIKNVLWKKHNIVISEQEIKTDNMYYDCIINRAIEIANREYHVNKDNIFNISIKTTKFKSIII